MPLYRYLVIFFAIYTFANDLNHFTAIPDDIVYDKKKASLGKIIFFEPSFSSNGLISCASCHSIEFDESIKQSNAPTLLNSYLNYEYFISKNFNTKSEQIPGHQNIDPSFNYDKNHIVKIINSSPLYKQKFRDIYKSAKIDFSHFVDVIVEFQKSLLTPNSKFDRYLKGSYKLTKQEKMGLDDFMQYGCITCHNGVNLGGNSYQVRGVMNLSKPCLNIELDNIKRYKVPTLRNIALTAPYYHDGRVKNLKDTLKLAGLHNIGIEIEEKSIYNLIHFLNTLTGKKPEILSE